MKQHGLGVAAAGRGMRRRAAMLVALSLVGSVCVVANAENARADGDGGAEPSAWTQTVSMTAGTMSTLAGNGTSAVQNGTGQGAEFGNPQGVSVYNGFAYTLDSGYVRQISLSTGAVSVATGNGTESCVDGPVSSAEVGMGVSPVNDGQNLFWLDPSCPGFSGGAGGKLREMSLSTGAVSTIPGGVIGQELTVGPGGVLYVANGGTVFSVDITTGTETMLAALPAVQYRYSDSPGITGLTADGTYVYATTSVYDCDCTDSSYSGAVQINATTGAVVTLYQQPFQTAGWSGVSGPVVSAGSYLYIANGGRILRMSKSDGSFISVVGSGASGFADGTGANGWLYGIETGIDTDGTNLYVADADDFRIRKVVAATPLIDAQPPGWSTTTSMQVGSVSTLAGSGQQSVTDGTGTGASFGAPVGLAVSSGYAYTTDDGYIRRIGLGTGVVTTVSGNGAGTNSTGSSCGASVNPSQTLISGASDLVTDGSFLYWSDPGCGNGSGSAILRRMSLLSGAVSTVPGMVYCDDNGLTVGPNGQLYVSYGGQIESVNPTTGQLTLVASLPYPNGVSANLIGLAGDSSSLYASVDYRSGGNGSNTWSGVYSINPQTGNSTSLYTQPQTGSEPYVTGPLVSAGANLFVAGATSSGSTQILELSKQGGIPSAVAGSASGFMDGTGTAAEFGSIAGLDTDGTRLYVADTANHRIREISVGQPASTLPPQTTITYPTGGLGPGEAPGPGNDSEPCSCAQGQVGQPINTSTGAYWEADTDLSVASRGPQLAVTRTYVSSNASQNGLFGDGWSSNLDMHLTLDSSNGDVSVHQDDGSQVAFAPDGAGNYTPVQPRILATMSESNAGVYTFVANHRLIYTFSAGGLLQSISDLNGNTLQLGYHANGTLASATDASGRMFTFTVNASGHVTQVHDGAGRTVVYGYTGTDLTSVQDPTGATWTYTYNSSNQMLTALNPNQQSLPAAKQQPLTNVYDSSGRVTSQTDFAGRVTTFNYTAISGATEITDPAGHVTVDYYTNGLRTKSTVGYGTAAAASTTFTYDPTTEAPATVTDPLGNKTTYTYDARGNILTVTDPLNRKTTNTFDALNDLLTSTDPTGVVTTNVYDSHGNLTSTSTPLLAANGSTTATRTTSFVYGDPANPGLPTSVTDPDNHTTTNVYDAYGDLLSTTAPPTPENSAGDETSYSYNPNTGWLLSTVAPKGNLSGATAANYTTSYNYDADGRLLQTKDALWSSTSPTLHQTSSVYDLDGNTTSSTDSDGHVTSYVYDADDEPVTTNLPNSTSTQQSWTPDGQPATSTDASGRVTTNTYNSVNELVSVKDPLNLTTTYTYDLAGNLVLTAAPGATCTGSSPTAGCTAGTYDADHELTARTYLDGATPNVSFSYDADGRRTAMSDASGSSSYTYDSLGRMTSSTDGDGVTISYGYDLAGNRTSLTYPGGNVLTSTYDAQNRMASQTDWQSSALNFGYDADSNPISTVFPSSSGETDTNTYNSLDQLTGITDSRTASGTTSTLANFAYTRDSGGQLASSVTTGVSEASQSYSRNAINQLTTSGSSTPTSYGYTPTNDISNRGSTSNAGNTQTFNADDQLCWSSASTVTSPTCASPPTGATSYTYDSRGNRTQAATAATGAGISIDKTVSADTAGTTGTVTTPAFSTTAAGETLLALTANSMAASGTRTVTVSGAGLTWTLVTRDTIRDGDAEIWKATAPAALSNVTVSAVQAASNRTHQTLTVIALKGAAGVGASAQAGAASGAPTVSLATTAVGSMVFATGNDYYNATTRTLASGQSMVHEFSDTSTAGAGYTGDDYWVQRTTAVTGAAGSTVTMADTAPTGDEYNMAAVEVTAQGAAQSTGYVYNEANELIKYTAPNGVSTTYTYDGDGLRQSKTTAGVTTYFTWEHDTGTPLLLADGSNSYIYANTGTPIEQINNTGGTTWLHDDQLGSVRLLTDYFGNVVGTNTYDPYGTRTNTSGNVTSPLGYEGQYTDTESGLIYLRARYYDPATAQFLTRDPLNALTGQPYNYAGDNPTDNSDPTGLCPGFLHSLCVVAEYASGYDSYEALSGCIGAGTYSGYDCAVMTFDPAFQAMRGYSAEAQASRDGCPLSTVAADGLQGTLGLVGMVALAAGVGEGVGGAADTGAGDLAGATCGGESFTPDTDVVMSDGSSKPLDQVKVGEKVEATDTKTGKTTAQTVTAVWVNHDTDLMDVTVEAGGKTSTIQATQHHLFWDATRKAWVEADQLAAGDQLRTDDGQLAAVELTVIVLGAADMWDLAVDNDHDFYVVTTTANVLVHNCPVGPEEVHGKVQSGARPVDESGVWSNYDEQYVQPSNGAIVRTLDNGNGTTDVVIRYGENPHGTDTVMRVPNAYVQGKVSDGAWTVDP